MWIFILFMVVSAKVALGAVSCTDDPLDKCGDPVMFERIPVSALEFEELCPEIPKYAKCLREYDLSCPGDDDEKFFTDEEYTSVHDLFTVLCNPESLLHKVVAENIKCLNETFKNTMCVEDVGPVIEPYKDPESYKMPDKIKCLRDVSVGSCLATDISKNCNSAAKDAAVEILRRSYYVQEFCSVESAKELLEEMDDFKLKEENKELVIIALMKLIQTESNVPFSFL
ncbi:uncharacterized protein TNIN_317151 [Trichonephila inaurata madagascariensis]|uniref:Uncharacterized protein n=1 Tax=Trichonephila inaurata madagascariensis TaxID=2747483 RepID=A0A8X6MC53_9ARAC|nr:uncharacterized protein TNIN_317151 [Trichonephila inaurata madagascariensis]